MRASGTRPSPSTASVIPASSCKRARVNNACSSLHVGICSAPPTHGEQAIGLAGFGYEYSKFRNVGVPLEQCRHRSKTRYCQGEELPYRRAHRCTVVVDQDPLPVGVIDGVPGEMHLPDDISREHLEVRDGILVEVLARHVDVVHIAQKAAVRAPDDGGEAFWLWY